MVPDIAAVARRFDYLVPGRLADRIGIGSRVRVDLHGRRVAAWVVDVDVEPPDGVSPREIAAWSGSGPPAPVVDLAEWAAWRWAGPVPSFLRTASPERVVRPADRRPDVPDPPPVPSPGGESVAIVERVLDAGAGPGVVRLAPTLDATLLVTEVCHRLGSSGVLVLVPSRDRADGLARRLRAAGQRVALLPDDWAEAATGRAVVVGTRAAAWAPLPRLVAAVVLDAQDEAYTEERSPTWSAPEVVAERSRRDGAPCLLVSPCPPVVLTRSRPVVSTSRAAERRGWPPVEVVDRRGDDPRTGLFSERLATVLHGVLTTPGGRVVCVLNRTGRARLLACVLCGALARCTTCGGHLEQPAADGPLVCRRCGDERPPLCADCDSTRLKLLRIGVSRATEELSALTGVPATEVTASTDDPGAASARLVVGTEAALHRVSRADVVAFVDFDQHLLAPRFAAAEEALGLLARAARLVGGRDGEGRLLVQTRLPDHEVLRAAGHADPAVVDDSELEVRRTLSLPPFSALATLGGPASDTLAGLVADVPELTLSRTASGDWLVRAPDHRSLCDALAAAGRPPGRLRVSVDPTDV